MNVEENRLSPPQLLKITKALADPQRFAILERIAAEPEVACKQLVAEFPITQATISHHLKELVAADLIQSRRVGQRSEEHTSESSHVKISYAVFCLKKKNDSSEKSLTNAPDRCYAAYTLV